MPNYGELRTPKTLAETLHDLRDTFNKWGVAEWDAPRLSTRDCLLADRSTGVE